MCPSLEDSATVRAGEALKNTTHSWGTVFMNFYMGQIQRFVFELFVTERAAHNPRLMQAFVVLELYPITELLPTFGAGVAPLVMLDPLVPGHVVVLAEGLVADGTLERPLLGVHSHVSCQFVGPPE